MKRRWISFCAVVLWAGQSWAQSAPPAAAPAPPDLKTNQDKASYAIGLNIGRSLGRENLQLNLNALFRGVSDAVAGRPSAVSEKELQAAMEAFQREHSQRMAERNRALGEKNRKEGEAFLAANKKRPDVVTLPSGLQYRVLQQGNGPSPSATDRVRTHYRGVLVDGTEFDSSIRRGAPAVFQVNQVIPGWSEALQRMKVGDKWQLFVPSELAYGQQGAGAAIGPNAVLIFEVELLGIEK